MGAPHHPAPSRSPRLHTIYSLPLPSPLSRMQPADITNPSYNQHVSCTTLHLMSPKTPISQTLPKLRSPVLNRQQYHNNSMLVEPSSPLRSPHSASLTLTNGSSDASVSRWKHDNPLKRTIESMTIGVEKIICKMGRMGKSGEPSLSRPVREDKSRFSNCSSVTSLATAPSSRTAKEMANHGSSRMAHTTRSNRLRSRIQKRKSVTSPSSQASNLNCIIQLSSSSDTENGCRGYQLHSFEASAGAGAKASVPQLKQCNVHSAQLSEDFAPSPCNLQLRDIKLDCPDWENFTAQSLTDSMDLDTDSPTSCSFLLDPIQILPSEITTMILALLDKKTLENASLVSRSWRAHALTNAVWRDFFFANFKPPNVGNTSYLLVGGVGLGKQERIAQPWRRLTKVRFDLEKAWQKASPAATYFCGHTDSVYCCQFDEHKIITGSRDRTIRVWDLRTKRCLKVIGSPSHRPTQSNLAPLATHASMVMNVESVNGTPQGEAIFHVPTYYHHASILCLQFDHQIMVTGSSDSTCIVWDVSTYQPLAHLRHHRSGVLDVCFDQTYIVSCSKDNVICIWSRTTYELVKILTGHTGPVNAVQMRGKKLVSASGDGSSRLWDLGTFSCQRVFQSKDRGLAAVEFSDDGKYVIAGGNDQVIYKYDSETAEVVHSYLGHKNLVRSLFLDCRNRRVLSGSYDQGIRVFDFDTGKEVGVYENWTTSWILSAKCDYRRIVATSQDGRVLLMDFGHNIPDIELLSS